jgi:hypothetical protein
MNKTHEVALAIVLAISFMAILQGHRLHKEGKLPHFLTNLFEKGQMSEGAQPVESAASLTEVMTIPAFTLPSYAMVNQTVILKHPKTKQDIGTIKQGTVVDVREQKGTFFLIYVNEQEGILPYKSLTFRK